MKFRVLIDDNKYWYWCIDNLTFGTWRKLIPLVGATATYVFDFPEDAIAFKLRWGINETKLLY